MIRNMDTSTKYIEMCCAAEEIQKEWNPKIGDYFFSDAIFQGIHSSVAIPDSRVRMIIHHGKRYEETWLPRQDQLQDLLRGSLKDIVEGFYDYMTAGGYDYEYPEFNDARCKEFGSMEQLWLAYVMETKYGKQWDGVEWIGTTGSDPNAPKESLKPLLSQILDTHARFQDERMTPKLIIMSSETWKDLEADLIHYRLHVSTAPSGVESIYGLRVAIDNNFKKGEFQITGVPL